MKVIRLRNRLLLSATVISLVITLGAMLVVSWVIEQQFQDESKVDLIKTSDVIRDSLAERKESLATAARQLAAQRNLGSTIWYLEKYGQSSVDREMLFTTYQQLAKDAYKIGRVAKLSKIAIFDSRGHLVAFSLADTNGEQVGFVRNFAKPEFHVATLKSGEELNLSNLQTTGSVARIGFEYNGILPPQENEHYAVADGMLMLESCVPIMGEVLNAVSGKAEIKQLGLIVAAQPLDHTLVDYFSRFTNIKINIFTRDGLSSGVVSGYSKPDWSILPATGEDSEAPIFNEILIEGIGYYQSLIPLYSNKQLVGGIAALHSKELVRKNTREMMRTMGIIAAVSLLLILAFAWYFATSITRPLTVLRRIFHDVARGKQSGTTSTELSRLKEQHSRQDELGDLTQSFVAMNDAVNQKIEQINEINASLERTVNERTAALAAREQESRTLIENTPDTIARYDRECRRIYVNPAFGALAEGGVAALIGTKPSEIPGGENSDIYEAKIREVFATGKNSRFEMKWQGKEGREICSHIRLTAERDLSGKVISVLGVGRDITELNEYRAELTRKELAKSRFLAAAGHDLRQPLAAANLFIDALKLTGPTVRQAEMISHLDQAMGTFNGLLDALLNISKLDAEIIKPEYTQIEVAELFQWLEQNLAPLAAEKQLAFKLHFPLSGALVVRSDLGLIKSALMNIVSNAIKFTAKGGILVGARRRGSEVLIQVWDTGTGISAEHIEHIFDEFYQVNNPQRDRTCGLGLGLSIAKRALTLLGAKICCRSQVGRGSVFEFRLPLEDFHEDAAQLPIPASQTGMNHETFVRGKHFIVVEDDMLVAQAITGLLQDLGGIVNCFHRAEEALRYGAAGHADYYIADYMLGGGLNGVQFLKQLRQKLGKPICAVLVSGDTSPSFIREVADFDWPILHKPANISEIIAKLGEQQMRT